MSDEETWLEARATYEKLAMGRRKVELTSVVRPILERLQRVAQTLEELRARYHAGDEWWLQIARTGIPTSRAYGTSTARPTWPTAYATGNWWVRRPNGADGLLTAWVPR